MPEREVMLARARTMRKEATDAERVLRSRQFAGLKFRRQLQIGAYIADFACLNPRVVIECDGGQHVENVDDESETLGSRRRAFASSGSGTTTSCARSTAWRTCS